MPCFVKANVTNMAIIEHIRCPLCSAFLAICLGLCKHTDTILCTKLAVGKFCDLTAIRCWSHANLHLTPNYGSNLVYVLSYIHMHFAQISCKWHIVIIVVVDTQFQHHFLASSFFFLCCNDIQHVYALYRLTKTTSTQTAVYTGVRHSSGRYSK